MDCISGEEDKEWSLIIGQFKKNVNKDTFLVLILKMINEFKKTEYKNSEARDFFYNIVFETIFSIDVDNSYVLVYINYFKSNVPFNLERFELVIKNFSIESDLCL
jgi:hypothetical protein